MKLISHIKSWYRENSRYYYFDYVCIYAFWLPLLLLAMVMSGNIDINDWVIFVLNVCIGLNFYKDYSVEKRQHEYHEFIQESVKQTFDLLESTSESVRRWQERLIAANRRRKRAERKLKKMTKRYYHERLLSELHVRSMIVTPEQRAALAKQLNMAQYSGSFKPGMLTYQDPAEDVSGVE